MKDHDYWSDFSLMEGGPLYRLGRRIGLPDGRPGFVRLGLIIALLTWLPLFAFAGIAYLTSGSSIFPFLYSLGTHVRLLVAIPLFFIAEGMFNARVREAIRLMVTGRLITEQQLPRFNAALRAALTWRDTWIVEAALAVLTLVLVWSGIRGDVGGEISPWRSATEVRPTLAGWWYSTVAIPAFQFLFWRWCVRLLIWWQLLWRISRLELQMIPTHPDRAGGLGLLGVVHVTLAPLNFAVILTLVATFVEEIWFGGMDVQRLVMPLTASIVGNSFALVAPLLFFTARLLEVKQRGVLEYGVIAQDYVVAFDAKWRLTRHGPQSEPLLGSADLQSLADLANSFDVIRGMRIIPMAGSQIVLLVAAAIVPALPLVLFVIPLDELILQGVRTLFRL